MDDKWTSKLPDGREGKYKSRKMLSGRFKISAEIVDADLCHSKTKIVDYPVQRGDVETVFLSDLM